MRSAERCAADNSSSFTACRNEASSRCNVSVWIWFVSQCVLVSLSLSYRCGRPVMDEYIQRPNSPLLSTRVCVCHINASPLVINALVLMLSRSHEHVIVCVCVCVRERVCVCVCVCVCLDHYCTPAIGSVLYSLCFYSTDAVDAWSRS